MTVPVQVAAVLVSKRSIQVWLASGAMAVPLGPMAVGQVGGGEEVEMVGRGARVVGKMGTPDLRKSEAGRHEAE